LWTVRAPDYHTRYDETNAFLADKPRPECAIEEVLQVKENDAGAPGSRAGKQRLSIDESKVAEVEVSEAANASRVRATDHPKAPNPGMDSFTTNPGANEGDPPNPTEDVPAPNPGNAP